MTAQLMAAHSAQDWWSGHVHYQEDLDRVVREVVAPVGARLDERGLPWFYLRYWEGGSHVRLRVLAPDPATRDEVAGLVETSLGALVAVRPSAGSLSADEYAEIAPYLARREGMPDHRPTLAEDNRVHVVPYVREEWRYGTGPAIQAVEAHFTESSRIAVRVVTAEPPMAPDGLALEVLVATCEALRRAGLLTPHRLAAAREQWRDPANAVPALEPAELERRYLGQRSVLVPAAQALLDPAGSPSGVPGAWVDSVDRLVAALAGADPAPDVAGVVDLCAHLFCNRLGVSMPSEIYLRHLATRAVEEAL